MALLLDKEDSGRPLYLVAACEELRNFAVYERMTPFIRNELPGSISQLFAHLLGRLETDHGEELVSLTLSFIAHSRAGMLEMEMIDVLETWAFKTEPISNFARLYTAIRTFVTSGGAGLLQLFHQTLLSAVTSRFTPSSDRVVNTHAALARYFLHRADPQGNRSWSGNYPRGLQELCFHLAHSRQWPLLESVLTDLVFVEARCRSGIGYELVADYNLAAETAPASAFSSAFAEFRRFFVANVFVLNNFPDQVRPQAAAQQFGSAVCNAIEALPHEPLLQLVNKDQGYCLLLTFALILCV